jgi:ABC-type multidrug transport system fused ATPase/permease subunit
MMTYIQTLLFDLYALSCYCSYCCYLSNTDPVCFVGTVRSNLDPFNTSDDATVWSALRAAHLSDFVSGLEGKLDAEVS